MQSQDFPNIPITPLVTIQCITYNHESYIRQCLEGFIMQKTTFPFEAIVHDDASTDGTAAIIREYSEKYPDIIKPIYETENQYSKRDGSLTRIMNAHTRGKYVAICEGDDYWIDPLKLQKQVDFLESHPECSLVCTDINYYIQRKDEFINAYFRNKKFPIKYTYNDFLTKAWFVAPCTWVYRKEMCKENGISLGFVVGDLPLLLELSSKGKIKYLDDVTAVYRVLDKSVSHFKDFAVSRNFVEGIFRIQLYYIGKNGNLDLLPKIAVNKYILLLKYALKNRKLFNALYYLYLVLLQKISLQ